ncbi:MAG: DUF3300 domain-containing protein [Proteobacteria bacterium]|nr:DUF3300 domain-containing protein [Pseudomonadota bacterium]
MQRLDQLPAPIALYRDDLLSNAPMASTYRGPVGAHGERHGRER